MSFFKDSTADQRISTVVLTGALGSGKTTLLNHLVQSGQLKNTAIVINEVGEIPLDQIFVQTSDESVVTLANGCVCCTVREDLEGAMANLFSPASQGDAGLFERVILETTGLADPAPVLQTFLNHPFLSRCFRLDAVVTMVDAVHGEGQLSKIPETVNQVALSDRILITKSDMVDETRLLNLRDRLREINTGAPISSVLNGRIAPVELFCLSSRDEASLSEEIERWRSSCDEHGHESDFPLNHRHGSKVTTFSLVFDASFSWKLFSDWMRRLRVNFGDNLLRVKGIVALEGELRPLAIHGVHHVFHEPMLLKSWPNGDQRSRIVFIAENLRSEEALQQLEAAKDWIAASNHRPW